MLKFFKNLFAPKPFHQGYLNEHDGHKIYFAEYGNPQGLPILTFHGGPGDASHHMGAKKFDLKKYRVIAFDQRGCGKSLPSGEMKNNTAEKNIEDAKMLVEFLNVKGQVIVFGSSWGSTLALLFAQNNPSMVSKLIVTKVFLANERDKDWQYKHSSLFYPDIWEKVVKEADGAKDVAKQYAEMINSDDMIKQVKAVMYFCGYEHILGSLEPSLGVRDIDADTINSAKIFINYTAKDFTLKNNQILDNMSKIKNIPALIVHNRLDMVAPLQNVYELHKEFTNAKLVVSPHIGHWGKKLNEIIYKEINEFLS